MLDSIIPELDYTSTYGSSVLKSLQNDNLPELDLLVREAIQNSSDAAIGLPEKSFNVNFSLGTFAPDRLNDMLSGISSILNDKYQGSADFLEIRDYKTSGLTGPVRKSELDPLDHKNYFKLVFDTGKEQLNSSSGEAGGSYGYGKSVYYRIGIGLVIFYSRISLESGGNESRLIISLIEHETGEKSILQRVKKNTVGRAWWGRIAPDDETELLPLTDETEIGNILNIFDVKPFSDSQTGTAIIIPYIDKAKLLSGLYPENCGIDPEEVAMCTFKDDIAEYIRLSIQKWYAPKIFNKALENIPGEQKWLNVRVNGNVIKNSTSYMRPFFLLVQELYNTALYACYDKPYTQTNFTHLLIKKEKIPSARVEGQMAGIVSVARASKEDLGNSLIQPYTFLRLFGKTSVNDPIVMFARTPGMVLDYKIDGPWAKNLIKPEEDDEYIVAFFVPKGVNRLKENMAVNKYSGIPLGEYLRQCEKSDHMDWNDKAGMTVVTNIRNQINNKINHINKARDDAPVEGTASKLSGKLGRRLLPTTRFGKNPGGSAGGDGGSGGGGKLTNLEFNLYSPEYGAKELRIPFCVKFNNNRKDAYFGLFVESEVTLMDAASWKANIETPFPLAIERIEKCRLTALNSDKTIEFTNECTRNNNCISSEYSTIEIIEDNDANVCGFYIKNEISNVVLEGILIVSADDKKYCFTIKEAKMPK